MFGFVEHVATASSETTLSPESFSRQISPSFNRTFITKKARCQKLWLEFMEQISDIHTIMSPALKYLTEEALKLSAEDKFTLIDTLSNSVERPITDIDKAWFDESIRRSDNYINDKTTAEDAVSAIKELSEKLIPQNK